MRKLHWQIVLTCLLLATRPAAADYRVDMIITLNRNAPPEVASTHGMAVQAPAPMAAIDINDKTGLQRAGINLLSDKFFGLDSEWRKLRNSRFRPILRLAWRIAQRPTASTLRLHDDFRYRVTRAIPDSPALIDVASEPAHEPLYEKYRLDGTVQVQQSAGLRVQLDLNYTVPLRAPPADYPVSTALTISASELATLSLHAEKRVNLGQKHFFDHPLLGVLLRVSQAD